MKFLVSGSLAYQLGYNNALRSIDPENPLRSKHDAAIPFNSFEADPDVRSEQVRDYVRGWDAAQRGGDVVKPAMREAIEGALRALTEAQGNAASASNNAREAEVWARRASRMAVEAEKAVDRAAILLSRVLEAAKLATTTEGRSGVDITSEPVSVLLADVEAGGEAAEQAKAELKRRGLS